MKWLSLCMYLCIYFSVFTLLATSFDILAQISYVCLLGLFIVRHGIRFLICHIVSLLWHMGRLSETTYMNGSKLDLTDAK